MAATDGVLLNQFIAAAVAEKVGSLRATDDFLRECAETAKPKDMLKYLREHSQWVRVGLDGRF